MFIRYALGIAIGAALGAAYYVFIGCRTGACPLTATIYRSAAYGAVMGALVANTFTRA